jgi:hypothetical protein
VTTQARHEGAAARARCTAQEQRGHWSVYSYDRRRNRAGRVQRPQPAAVSRDLPRPDGLPIVHVGGVRVGLQSESDGYRQKPF